MGRRLGKPRPNNAPGSPGGHEGTESTPIASGRTWRVVRCRHVQGWSRKDARGRKKPDGSEMVVIRNNPDRLGREPVDLLIIARVFHAAGVRLEFVNGPSDRDDNLKPNGQAMFILGYVGSGEKERIQIMEPEG